MASKKPKTLETLKICLELLRSLSKTRKISSSELRERLKHAGFERDERSIQRLLAELCDTFETIERDDSSSPYGYKWSSTAAPLVLPGLTAQESLLLILAKRQMLPLLPPRTVQHMSGFFDQAQHNLRHKDDAALEKQWLSKVRVVSETQPLLSPQIGEGVLDAVSQALYSNHWLSIDYVNQKDERKQALVMPLGLVQQGPRMYLVCQFEGYTNQRILALHRLQAASVTSTPFDRPNFDLEAYEYEGNLAVANGPRIRLSFDIDKGPGKHLLESRLSEDQEVQELENTYRITATVQQTLLLDRWLSSFGDGIRGVFKSELV
jgi:predicted DNA-binding transcriptional regulator YafY